MPKRLSTSIGELSRQIDALDTELARSMKINVNCLRVLDQLYQVDQQKPSALARSVGMPPTSFTPALDNLERAGLIARKPHPKDRRAIQILLTAKAEKWRTRVVGHMEAIQTRLVSEFKARAARPSTYETVENMFAPLPESAPF